jgi:AcrR family transcriptional regulator
MSPGIKLVTRCYAGGMNEPSPISVRERSRRAVQAELTTLAQDLFLAHGYEQTTVDEIAAAAGMSKRTFFRYFASKDDLVIGKYDLLGDRMAEALAARPETEPVWESMRRVFDITVHYVQEESERRRTEAMENIVHSSPSLNARYFEKLSRMQALLVEGVADRLVGSSASPPADPRPAAIVGAAFACLTAAQATFVASDRSVPFSTLLDASMNALRIV